MIAIAVVAAGRFAMFPVLGDVAPLLPFILAVVLTARYGGLLPGLVATGTSALVAAYLFVPPRLTLQMGGSEAIGFSIYLLIGAVISWVCESLLRANRLVVETQRRSESANAFLLELEQSLREPADPVTIERSATTLLQHHLGVERCFFNEIDLDARTGQVTRAAEPVGLPSAVGHYRLEEFVGDDLLARHALGETTVIDDVFADGRITGPNMAAAGFRAFIIAPCSIQQRRVIALNVTTSKPRAWREDEARLIHETAVRVWPAIEHARARRAHEIAMEQLQIATDAMSAPVTRCNRSLEYVWVSNAYARWLGTVPERIVGRPIIEVFGREAFEQVRGHFERVLAGERVEYEDVVRFPQIGERWIHCVYTPTRDQAGEIDGWVAVVLDVDERRKLEEALRESDRRKDHFLATLAHELRNPLAPVRNAVEILKAPQVDDPTSAWCRDVIDRQVAQMTRLVDDLLDVSRITGNVLELRRQRVDLAAVVENSVETSRPHLDAGGHQISIRLPSVPVVLDVDPLRVAQALSNLLTNAAKYTPQGGHIQLEAETRAGQLAISVRDDGTGIEPDLLPHLFERFSRAAPHAGRSGGGLGIGLSLVRGLIELHGGTVEARSEGRGHGSEFIVRLPLTDSSAVTAPRAVSTATPAIPSRQRILVVDDNTDSADSLATFLRLQGHQVETVYDGMIALEAAAAHRPDLVLLDLGMPAPDGFEVCRAIRREPWGKAMRVVAVTGWGQQQDRHRTELAGFDGHLVKPLDGDAIAALLFSLGSEPRAAPRDAAPQTT